MGPATLIVPALVAVPSPQSIETPRSLGLTEVSESDSVAKEPVKGTPCGKVMGETTALSVPVGGELAAELQRKLFVETLPLVMMSSMPPAPAGRRSRMPEARRPG